MKFTDIAVFVGYAVFILIGRIYDLFTGEAKPTPGYAPLIQSFDGFYIRRIYNRVRDTFNHVISSRPDRVMDIEVRRYVDSHTKFEYDGNYKPYLNLASYNYLGFADSPAEVVAEVNKAIGDYGLVIGAAAGAGGRHKILVDLEREVAAFVGCEDAMVVAQGFATNSLVIPAIAPTRDTLIISDALNHASIICGIRSSRACIQVFMHNNMRDLERLLRNAVTRGQPRTHRPWQRIIVAVEGIYSMEGEVSPMHIIAPLCRKYGAQIWLDEAHSIGAIGNTGRGVCELCEVPADLVAVKMGTFTKSFGAVGGYVAGSKGVIATLRHFAAAHTVGEVIPPVIAAQCLAALRHIQTETGRKRLAQLRENCRYFREELLKGCHDVLGHPCSPVVPVITRAPGRGMGWNRLAADHGLAAVVVGYPAVPITEARVRFCLSASHTRSDLERAIASINEVRFSVLFPPFRDLFVTSHQVGTHSSTRLAQPKHDEAKEFWEEDGSPKFPEYWARLKSEYGH